jgi:probable F420-dependent oxidoreductase
MSVKGVSRIGWRLYLMSNGTESPKISVPTGAWNMRAGISAEQVLDAARKADAAGIGLFAGDHVTFYGTGNDGLVNLAAVATVTKQVEIMTSVYLLALRHPTPVALQCAMLDQLADGRFTLGVGIGGEDEAEWRACGVDPRTRAGRTNEALQILRSLWTNERTSFQGRHFNLDEVRMQPKPFREDGIPLFVGGRSDGALRRTARFGDGWIAIWVSPRRMAEAAEKIGQWAEQAGRDGSSVELGLQIWCALDDDREVAREALAQRMEDYYRIPFERFERYCAYGPPEEIANYLRSYQEVGCQRFNLVSVQGSQDEVVEAATAVKTALATTARD